eukprot:XP_025007655.1 carbohydrate sulfotransferase 11 [Gallus gallus]
MAGSPAQASLEPLLAVQVAHGQGRDSRARHRGRERFSTDGARAHGRRGHSGQVQGEQRQYTAAAPATPRPSPRGGGGPSRQPGASPPADTAAAVAAAGRDHLSPWRGGGRRSAPAPRPARLPPRRAERPSACRAAWSRPAQALAPPGTGRGRPGILRRGGGSGFSFGGDSAGAAASLSRAVRCGALLGSAMKPAVLEVMRMNRVCRMVLVTSVGSFILVIFYFQSMLLPVMRRNPFGMDICCRKGSRSPLQELYNPTQLSNTAILHQIRRDQVTDTCRANSVLSRKRRVLTPNDLKHLVVDEDHEMIYCYVPKVACTNWKRVMMVLTGRGKYSDPMEIPANEAHVSSNLKTLNQYSIPEINHRLKNYMKFLFVREPFERLVSAYRNKFTQKYNTSFHKRYGTKIVRRQRKNATQEALRKGDDVKFEEFVAYLIDPHTQREEPFNEHWQTVYSLCHPCHIHYDLIGKYETLEEDSNYILQLAGVGNYLKFPTYAKSTRTTDEMTTEFFQNISSEHQTQLYEVYKLDFLMFNYSVPSYLKLE